MLFLTRHELLVHCSARENIKQHCICSTTCFQVVIPHSNNLCSSRWNSNMTNILRQPSVIDTKAIRYIIDTLLNCDRFLINRQVWTDSLSLWKDQNNWNLKTAKKAARTVHILFRIISLYNIFRIISLLNIFRIISLFDIFHLISPFNIFHLISLFNIFRIISLFNIVCIISLYNTFRILSLFNIFRIIPLYNTFLYWFLWSVYFFLLVICEYLWLIFQFFVVYLFFLFIQK